MIVGYGQGAFVEVLFLSCMNVALLVLTSSPVLVDKNQGTGPNG